MKIYANLRTEVNVERVKCAEALLDDALKSHEYLKIIDNKHYICRYDQVGPVDSEEIVRELSREEYEYIGNVQKIVKYLQEDFSKVSQLRRDFEKYHNENK